MVPSFGGCGWALNDHGMRHGFSTSNVIFCRCSEGKKRGERKRAQASQKEERTEGREDGRTERQKDGRKDGRKEGRKEARRTKGKTEKSAAYYPYSLVSWVRLQPGLMTLTEKLRPLTHEYAPVFSKKMKTLS